jgi:hypothetical protein
MRKILFLFLAFCVSIFQLDAQRVITGDTLKLKGGANIMGKLDLNSNKIINLLDPTQDQDAATKKYVDDNTLSGDNPFIDFEVNTLDPVYKQARLWYDSLNSEMVFYDAIVDVKFGTVSELSFKIINTTGLTLSVGDIVYPTGVSSGFTTVALAQADDYDTSRPVGMIKTETLNGQVGWVTIKGKVEGVNTSTLSGGIFYLSPTTAGDITQVRPTGGDFVVRVGAVKEVAVDGSVEIDVFTSEYTAESISPRGWSEEAISNTILAPTSGTRTFQVLGTSYIYEDGIKYDISNESVVWADIEGTVDFYFDQGVLTAENNLTEAQVRDRYSSKPGVARMYWDATNDTIIYVNDMRHTFDMNGNTWATFWDTHGCIVLDGLGIVDIQTEGTGNVDADAQFGNGSGTIRNQDIVTDVPAFPSTGGYTVFYRTGTTAWRSVEGAPFPVITTGTGRLAWNEDVAGTWQLTEVVNGDFVLYHLFTSNTLGDKMGTVVGQMDYATLSDARDGAVREIQDLLFAQFPIRELAPVATVIYETRSNYSNAVKARTRQSTDQFGTLVDFIDWRDQRAISGSTGGSGASTFLDLTDTPATYAGAANQAATVNGTEDGLSFQPVVLTINGIAPTAGNYDNVLSNNKVGENVTVSPQGTGTGTTFSVADNDSDPDNENQDLGNSKLNNDVTVTISNGTNTTITNLARTDFFNVFSVGQEIEGGLSVLDDVTAENLLAANKVSVGTSVLSQVDKTGRLRLSGSDFESTSEGALISLEGVDFGGIGNGGNLELLAGAGGIVSTNAQTNIGGLLTAPNFISTVATGTAPLTVNSVTRVDNLNVEFLNGQSEGYFLNTTQFGAANGVATLDGSAKIPISQIPDALIGAVVYQGTWNANANSPTLTSSVGNKGNYYTVTVAGNTILDGTGDWRVGDMVIFNGSIWEKIDNNHDVTSVFGRTGTVTAQNGDYNTSLIPEGINLYYTTARVNADAPNVTLAGENYLSLLGQQITANQINLASHVTGILSDGNLSSNVALKNIDNNFSASQSITNGSDTDIILRVNGLDATSEYISMGIRPNYGVITAGYTGVGNTGLMFRASESTEYDVMELTFDGNLDLKSGAYQVAGQTVIDNSRNYTGGSGTFSGKLSVSSSGLLNQFEINRTDAGSVNFDFKSESALSHRFVSVKNGRLEIRDDDDATIFEVNDNAETELYYNKLLKLTTTSSGIDVTGTVTADNFLGEVQGSANTTPLRLQGQNNQRGVYIGFSGTDDDNIVFGTEASGVDSDFLTVGRTSLNATFAETVTANNIFKKATQTLSGTTPTYNCSTSVNAKITLTGNTTATLTNLVDGMSGNFYVTQDGTGGHTLTLSPTPKVINGGVGVVTLTGTAGSTDIISWAYDGTTLYVTYGLNYN